MKGMKKIKRLMEKNMGLFEHPLRSFSVVKKNKCILCEFGFRIDNEELMTMTHLSPELVLDINDDIIKEIINMVNDEVKDAIKKRHNKLKK